MGRYDVVSGVLHRGCGENAMSSQLRHFVIQFADVLRHCRSYRLPTLRLGSIVGSGFRRCFLLFVLLGLALMSVSCPPSNPSISSIDPTSGPSGTIVTVEGSNFGLTSTLLFDGAAVSRVGSESCLLFTVPYNVVAGTYNIQVKVGSKMSNTVSFQVTSIANAPVPNIEGYSVGYYLLGPAGTNEIMNVVLFGTGFDTNSVVVFDGNEVLTMVPGIPIGGLLGAFAQGMILTGYPPDHYDKAIAARLSENAGNLPALGSIHQAEVKNKVTGVVSNSISVTIPNRHVLVECDRVNTIDWPPTAIWRNNAINTLRRSYTSTGLLIDFRYDQSVADPNAGADYTDSDVTNFKSTNANLSNEVYEDEWYIYVGLVTTRDEPHLNFITFGRIFESNNRQGMVIFVSNLPGDQEYLRTLMHEMGHCFNLTHCEGDAVPQFNAAGQLTGWSVLGTTIMNQTWALANNWTYNFSTDSQDHLTNCPVNEVEPGPGNLAFNSPSRQEGQCGY